MDFSHGDGFYLDNDFDQALEWAKERHGSSASPAVLIYRIERAAFRDKYTGLNLQCQNRPSYPSFEEVVSNFRSGNLQKEFLRDVNKYDYIEGPWSAGPWPAKSANSKGRASPIKDTYQLCLRNDTLGSLFNRQLNTVVFFER